MRIDSSWNQINLTAGDTGDRKGQTIRMGDKSTENYGLVSGDSAPLLKLDGPKDSYTVEDAAAELWKRENNTLNPNDPAVLARLRDRLRSGKLGMTPTQEELTGFIQGLRQNGLDGKVDWSGLSGAFQGMNAAAADELADNIDYLASRYVAALDKLERNYSGDELAAQKEKLASTYQTGKAALIDGYAKSLQEGLGLSDANAQAVRDSLDALIGQKVAAYGGALGQVHQSVAEQGPDSVWLKNHDGYIAAQLRETGGAASAKAADARYSLEDLKAAGTVAQLYRGEQASAAMGSRNEATLALGLAMADMKAEALIGKGLVSGDMAALLRDSRQQAHQNVLAAADERLAYREDTRLSGEPQGAFAPLDRELFSGIHQAVMNEFHRNGGNGAEAIRAGVTYGKAATAQAHAKDPAVFRWGNPMEQYWKGFYTTPEPREMSQLEQQVENLLAQAGQTSNRGCSTFQTYANSWHDFMNAIGNGVDVRG